MPLLPEPMLTYPSRGSVLFCGIHLRSISQDVLKICINWWNEFKNCITKITATSLRGQWVNVGSTGWLGVYSAADLYPNQRGPWPVTSYGLTIPDSKVLWPTWGPPGSCRPQMGPMLAQWTMLSGYYAPWVQTDIWMSWRGNTADPYWGVSASYQWIKGKRCRVLMPFVLLDPLPVKQTVELPVMWNVMALPFSPIINMMSGSHILSDGAYNRSTPPYSEGVQVSL